MRRMVALAAFGLLHLAGAGISQADAQLRVVRVDEVPGIEGTYPSWAPDGERLAFERGGDLYIVERDGSNERRFVHDPALDETPVWVSKREILFASDREGELDVYRIRPDGSGLERITDDPADDDHPRPWPDGSGIVFNSKRHDGETYQIWSMNRDGRQARRLTFHSDWDSYPSISKDGRRLLWRRVVTESGRRNSEVFVMDLEEAIPTNLTSHPGFDGYPVWSPDEQWIAFASSRDSEGLDQLFVMRSDGSDVTRLNALEPGVQFARPSWSPDGTRIAATRAEGGVTTLVIFTVEPAAFAGCGSPDATSGNAAGAGPQLEIFAPGAVSSELPEFAVSFTPSGDTVFFNRTSADRSRIDLMYSILTPAGWAEAELYAPLAGVRAVDPFVTADGGTLYFSADLARDGEAAGTFNLWRLSRGDPEAEPVPLPAPVNTDSSEVFNSISAEGTMVFSSRRDGERRIYETKWDGERAREPTLLSLGGEGAASNPAIHPSGRLLVFARAGDSGPPDLFLSCRVGAEWGEPVRLPEPLNSPFAEFAPGYDSGYLYFTSERPGIVAEADGGDRPPGDIYRTPIGDVQELCGPTSGIR